MPLTDYQQALALLLAENRSFVDPRGKSDAVPHFGRPGGVVPRVVAT
jgi:hypothetical protein